MAKRQIQASEEQISRTPQGIWDNVATLTYPQELFIPLFLHKRLLQLLVQPLQAPVQAGAEPHNGRWTNEARRRVLQ